MRERHARTIGLGCTVAMLASAGVAHAGGLLLPGSGPVSTGRAGAAIASTEDPSALGVNPAGLAAVKGTMIYIGTSLISFHQTFTRAGTYDDVPGRDDPWEGTPYGPVSEDSKPAIGFGQFQAVPVIAIASDLGGKVKGLVVAAGIFAPNAYPTRSFASDYVLEDPNTPPPPTRYDVVEQTAAIVLPSIAVAYRPIDSLDVGARFSAGFGSIDATTTVWALTNFEEWSGKDGRFHVEAKDNFIPAFALGARFRPTPAIELAASWTSSLAFNGRGPGDAIVGSGGDITGSGTAAVIIPSPPGLEQCEAGGTRDALKACVKFQLPMTATLGARYIFRDASGAQVADVEANVDFEQWSQASTQEVKVDGWASVDGVDANLPLQVSNIKHNFQDTYSLRLGGSYQRVLGPGLVTVRGGVAYDTKAAKEGWERLDLDGAARTTIAAGASLTLKRVRIDIGGGIVHEGTRTQGIGCNPTVMGRGCDGVTPLPAPAVRSGPDPIQPLSDSGAQQVSPFNQGAISSGYGLLMVGVNTWF